MVIGVSSWSIRGLMRGVGELFSLYGGILSTRSDCGISHPFYHDRNFSSNLGSYVYLLMFP